MYSASTIYVVFGGVQTEIMKVKELYAQLGRGTFRRDVMVEVSSTHNPAVNHISGLWACMDSSG